MIGPVLALELQQANRGGRLVKLWNIYFVWLVLQFLALHTNVPANFGFQTQRAGMYWGEFVNLYLNLFVLQQFVLLVLATPTFVAGAIADEKTRGTLQLLFCADVSSWELVAGKLLGRLAQVAFLASAGLPFFCFVGGLGGLAVSTLVGLAGVTTGLLFGLGALSVLASVWSRETRDAVLRAYAALALGIVATLSFNALVRTLPWPSAPVGSGEYRLLTGCNEAVACLSPVYVLEPSWEYDDQATTLRRLGLSMAIWGGAGAVCTIGAAWRLRPAYLRQLAVVVRPRAASRRPAWTGNIGNDPFAWKEQYFGGQRAWFFLPSPVKCLALAGLTLWLFITRGWDAAGWAVLVPLVAVTVVGVRASAAVSRERDRQTWDTLLLVPLETESLLRSKCGGIIRALYPYLGSYAGATALAACCGAVDVSIFALGLLVPACLGMRVMGAGGVLWSVRLRSAWKSLLATLITGYAGMVLVTFAGGVFAMVLSLPAAIITAREEFGRLHTTDGVLAVLLFLVGVAGFLFSGVYMAYDAAETCFLDAGDWIDANERAWAPDPPRKPWSLTRSFRNFVQLR